MFYFKLSRSSVDSLLRQIHGSWGVVVFLMQVLTYLPWVSGNSPMISGTVDPWAEIAFEVFTCRNVSAWSFSWVVPDSKPFTDTAPSFSIVSAIEVNSLSQQERLSELEDPFSISIDIRYCGKGVDVYRLEWLREKWPGSISGLTVRASFSGVSSAFYYIEPIRDWSCHITLH